MYKTAKCLKCGKKIFTPFHRKLNHYDDIKIEIICVNCENKKFIKK